MGEIASVELASAQTVALDERERPQLEQQEADGHGSDGDELRNAGPGAGDQLGEGREPARERHETGEREERSDERDERAPEAVSVHAVD